MKRFADISSFEDLKNSLAAVQKRDDNKAMYIFAGVVCLAIVAAAIAIIYFVKRNADDDIYADDWDDDWDEDINFYSDGSACADGECCCSDSDVDKSVKVEKL